MDEQNMFQSTSLPFAIWFHRTIYFDYRFPIKKSYGDLQYLCSSLAWCPCFKYEFHPAFTITPPSHLCILPMLCSTKGNVQENKENKPILSYTFLYHFAIQGKLHYMYWFPFRYENCFAEWRTPLEILRVKWLTYRVPLLYSRCWWYVNESAIFFSFNNRNYLQASLMA